MAKRRFSTTIRMGATGFSLKTTDGRNEMSMGLAKATYQDLASVAATVSDLHRITEKKRSRKKPTGRNRFPQVAEVRA